MAIERLVPNFVSVVSGWTGTIADIDEDPDTPDTAWFTGTVNTSPFAEIQFAEPVGTLISNQEFRLLFRKNGGSSTCTATVEVRNNGSVVATPVSGVSITSTTGQIVSFTVDASLFTSNGMNVSLYITTVGGGGSPGARSVVELGALEWNATVVDVIAKTGSDTSSISIADTSSTLKIDNIFGSDTGSLAISETSQITIPPFTTQRFYLSNSLSATGPKALSSTGATHTYTGNDQWGGGGSGTVDYWCLGDPNATLQQAPHSTSGLPTTIYAWLDDVTDFTNKRIQSNITGTYSFDTSYFFGSGSVRLTIRAWVYNTTLQTYTQIGSTFTSNTMATNDGGLQNYIAAFTIPVVTPVDFAADDKFAIEFVAGEPSSNALGTVWNGVMYNDTFVDVDLYSQSTADPISGSDTSSVAVSETSQLAITDDINVSDTGSLAVAESVDTFSDGTTSDTASLAVSETSSLLIDDTKSTTDSSSITITDVGDIAVDQPVSDSGNLSVTESASVLVLADIVANDTASLSVSEVAQQDVTLQSDDAVTLAATDDSASFRTIEAADSASLSISETSDTFFDAPGSDTGALIITETSDIVIGGDFPISGTETAQLAVAEQVDVLVDITATDTSGLVISETSDIVGTIVDQTATDTGSLAVTESSSLIMNDGRNGTDSASLTVTEQAELFKDIAASDTLSLSLNDASVQDIAVLSTEAASLAIDESIQSDLFIDTTDSGSLTITEEFDVFVIIDVGETGMVSVSETSGVVQDVIAPAVVRGYSGGLFHVGVVKVYKNGAWVVVPLKVYRSGTWT